MATEFSSADFEVFAIEGFAERMQALRQKVRPKLVELGEQLAPWLERETGLNFFPHVATHARRRVNPPDDTWVAFGRSPRGYKRYIHLTVAIDHNRLMTQVVVKPEADDKQAFAQAWQRFGIEGACNIAGVSPRTVYWFDERMGDMSLNDMKQEDIDQRVEVLLKKKSAGATIGAIMSKEEAVGWQAPQLLSELRQQLLQLIPIYALPLEVAFKS